MQQEASQGSLSQRISAGWGAPNDIKNIALPVQDGLTIKALQSMTVAGKTVIAPGAPGAPGTPGAPGAASASQNEGDKAQLTSGVKDSAMFC